MYGLDRASRLNQRQHWAATLGVFAGILCLLILGAVGLFHRKFPSRVDVRPSHKNERNDQSLFYKKLGQSPAQPGLSLSASRTDSLNQYTLEIKLARSREEAEKLIELLAGLGVNAYYTPLQRDGRVIYRVRRGLYRTQEQAHLAAEDLASGKNIAAKIVQLQ